MGGTAAAERPAGASERLPLPPRLARFAVLFAVFVCAACGLVYELALVALGSYLLGDTITQASVVLAVMVFAMGIGSLASKRLTRHPAFWFAVIEGLLSLVGGLSVLMLYAAFAWFSLYQPALVGISFLIGVLIGAEIPLLMTLIQRIRRQEAASAVADLFAADYVGGLIGGLAFPFLLLPAFGLMEGVLLVGMVNAVTGMAVVLWLFRRSLTRLGTVGLAAGLALVMAVSTSALALSDRFEVDARQALYRDPVVYAQRSEYQEIVLTENLARTDLRLFLNGDLQFSSLDEYRYHESLVHPVMDGPRRDVLVLGGGDGLALREVLEYEDVARVVLVDLDPAVVELARTHPEISGLNRRAFDDERVTVVNDDAFAWLRTATDRFDAVVVDLPDPDDVGTAKLYSVEFYGLLRKVMAEQARVVVQAGSPYFASRAYWSVEQSMNEAGLHTTPYNVDVPSFGNWGFFLARTDRAPELALPADAPETHFLDAAVLEAAQVFPKDRRAGAEGEALPSTLLSPRIIDYHRDAWIGY